MKGIAHFLTGVALATCIPEVVALAREGSLLPVLGGIAGLLPDLLDFRLVRYLERYDVEVDPGPDLVASGARGSGGALSIADGAARNAAQKIVDAFTHAMTDAFETGVPRRLVAHTVRCGADRWRRYTVHIDPETRKIGASIGPLVSTSQVPVDGSAPPHTGEVERRLPYPLHHDYRLRYDIDIFTGPSFRFARHGDGLVIDFLDWHHRWTHSLPLALAFGVALALLSTLLWGSATARLIGLVTGLAFAAHVLEDQLGHMGCNLFWPLTNRRQRGLGLLHAGDAAPNFLTVWTSVALILFNLDRAGTGLLLAVPYLGIVAAPWMFYAARMLRRRARLAGESRDSAALDRAERMAESHDGEVR